MLKKHIKNEYWSGNIKILTMELFDLKTIDGVILITKNQIIFKPWRLNYVENEKND